jgi:hypothetical protein
VSTTVSLKRYVTDTADRSKVYIGSWTSRSPGTRFAVDLRAEEAQSDMQSSLHFNNNNDKSSNSSSALNERPKGNNKSAIVTASFLLSV